MRYATIRRSACLLAGVLLGTGALLGAGIAEPAVADGSGRWRDYEIMIWQQQTPARLAGLQRLGVTGAAMLANRTHVDPAAVAAQGAPLLAAGVRPYVENIATDFYAAYHRWTPEHPVTWLFEEARAAHAAHPDAIGPWLRDPGLDDPAWLARIHDRLVDTVRAATPLRPLYYSLGDETGIADLSANWDFDFSERSLAGFRVWLRHSYGTLDALNREWDTHFTEWDAVRPLTTTEAMARPGDNFSPWSDFKAWMDRVFAAAVRSGTEAVHEADPAALAAIEGAQVPGWGGYDYTRLSRAVDVMEIYSGDDNMDIARAMNPDLVLLTTLFGSGTETVHDAWQALLMGSRGSVLWDDAGALVADDGTPGPAGMALAPLFAELRGGVGALLANATPHFDNVAILYSPASFRVQWMLDHRDLGAGWTARTAETELQDSALRAAMRQSAAAMRHSGVEPRWISPAMLEGGALTEDLRMLVLPHSVALSAAEAAAIDIFVARGGTVVADTMPGVFDSHGSRLPVPRGAAWFTAGPGLLMPDAAAPLDDWAAMLAQAGIRPALSVRGADGARLDGVSTRQYDFGSVRVVAVQRDGPVGVSADVEVGWGAPMMATDLRGRQALGWIDHARLAWPPEGPIMLALSAQPVSTPTPVTAQPDGVVLNGPVKANERADQRRIWHIAATHSVQGSSTNVQDNVVGAELPTVWRWPVAMRAVPGVWTIQVTDLFSTDVTSLQVVLPKK